MRADLLRERKKLCDENTRTWNFDFENEIPLPGRYDWQRFCASSSREKPILSLPDRVSEMGTTERLACFNDSAETRTTRSTTSSGTMDYAISNDANSDSLESSICDPEKRLKRLRERKPSDKITGMLFLFSQNNIYCYVLDVEFTFAAVLCSFCRLVTLHNSCVIDHILPGG